MRLEVKDVKQIVKVPRLHYKEIEKADLQALKTQYDSYKHKEQTFVTKMESDQQNGFTSEKVDKDQYRAGALMRSGSPTDIKKDAKGSNDQKKARQNSKS